jgi:hypothetical protein
MEYDLFRFRVARAALHLTNVSRTADRLYALLIRAALHTPERSAGPSLIPGTAQNVLT